MAEEKQRIARSEHEIFEPYITSVLTMKVFIPMNNVGRNIKENLEKMIVFKTEGKCMVEGFIRPESVRILTYSSGKVNGEYIEYHCTYECMICHPVEGMKVKCICKTVTKAGIHAEVVDKQGNIPIIVFIARDHHLLNTVFEDVRENSNIIATVIGTRFELNDPNICAIGKLVEIANDVGHKQPIRILED